MATGTEAPIPVWLDVDTGHDDAFALLLAAHSQKTKLLGVTTVHGNASVKNTTYNTLAILEAIGCRDVPVYQGSSKPLKREPVHADAIHGESGLDGVDLLPTPTITANTTTPFLTAMYDALIATPPQTAWIIATGTLTNVSLLLSAHPDLAAHLAGLSIMGGAVGNNFTSAPLGQTPTDPTPRFGNWTPVAEFNIYCDPEAAAHLLSHPILAPKTTLITLDLTHQVLATPAVQERLLHSKPHDLASERSSWTPLVPSRLRLLFVQILTFFARTYADTFGLVAGPPLHDPLAVFAAFAPAAAFDDRGGERFAVEVVTEGAHAGPAEGGVGARAAVEVGELGRTRVTALPQGEKGVRIPRAVDLEMFWEVVEDCLERAEALALAEGRM